MTPTINLSRQLAKAKRNLRAGLMGLENLTEKLPEGHERLAVYVSEALIWARKAVDRADDSREYIIDNSL